MGVLLESTYIEVIYVLAVLLLLFYNFATSTYNYWREKGVPFIKPVPLLGNTWATTLSKKSAAETFTDFYFSKEFENQQFGGIYLARKPVLIAKHPDFIKHIMIKDFQYFSDRGLTFNEKVDPLSAHLFTLGGWRWRALRMKLSPTFTSGKMKMMYGTMVECADRFEKILESAAQKGEVLEMKEPLAKFTTDVIGTCAFGLQLNAMSDDDCEFRKMGRRIFTPSKMSILKRSLASIMPFLIKYIRLSILPKEVSDFFLNSVNDIVRYREENNISRNDFMQLLIEIKNKGAIVDDEERLTTVTGEVPTDESGKQVLELTPNLLAAQAFIFFVGGFETASTTMSFALYELAVNPDVQEKLADEINEKISQNDDKLTYDLLLEMRYLDMVVSETLRKYPPVGNLFRQCTKPYTIPGTNVQLDAQSRVFIPVFAIQRDPQYYPDPERFDPERFTPEKKAKINPMVYMPFGDGPRNCIGARFGLLQTKLGLATLLRRYRFEVCEQTPIPAVLDPRAFITTLKGGVWLKITER